MSAKSPINDPRDYCGYYSVGWPVNPNDLMTQTVTTHNDSPYTIWTTTYPSEHDRISALEAKVAELEKRLATPKPKRPVKMRAKRAK